MCARRIRGQIPQQGQNGDRDEGKQGGGRRAADVSDAVAGRTCAQSHPRLIEERQSQVKAHALGLGN